MNKPAIVLSSFTHYSLFIIIFILLVSISSCTYDKKETAPCSSTVPETVSFHLDIIPLLHTYCSVPGCHTTASDQGNLNLDDSVAYSQLNKSGSGYINTVNPNFSVLYIQMTSVSTPMPPSGLLDVCETNLILRWIQQGGRNN